MLYTCSGSYACHMYRVCETYTMINITTIVFGKTIFIITQSIDYIVKEHKY